MWKASHSDGLKKVKLESDANGIYYLDYIQGDDGIYLSRDHLVESGLKPFDIEDIASALDFYNRRKRPHIYLSEDF